MASIPSRTKHKACLLCSIIQLSTNFEGNGCQICEEITQLRGSTGRMSVCTTTNFDGMIAVFDPKPSWVRLWTCEAKHVREMYAVRVDGRVPEDVEAELESPRTEYTERPE
ncbi:Spt4/RpoE2 zinc finger-domain-containing protein, partial [Pisolithus croceorrhizus]